MRETLFFNSKIQKTISRDCSLGRGTATAHLHADPIPRGKQARPKVHVPPATPNVSQKSLGTKIKTLGGIIKTVATRCHILRPKCNKFDFGWGSVPNPAREISAIPQTV